MSQDTASSLRIFAPIDAVMQLLSVELKLEETREMPRPRAEPQLPHVYSNEAENEGFHTRWCPSPLAKLVHMYYN